MCYFTVAARADPLLAEPEVHVTASFAGNGGWHHQPEIALTERIAMMTCVFVFVLVFLFSVLGVLNVLCSSSASRTSSFSSGGGGGGGGDLGLLQFGKCRGASEGNRKRKQGPWKFFDETQSDGKILEVVSSLFWRFRVRRRRAQPAAEFWSWTSWIRFWPVNTVDWRWSPVI